MRLETGQPTDVSGVVRPRSVNPTVASETHETASEQEPPAKRMKAEEGTASMGTDGTSQPQTANIPSSKTSQDSQAYRTSETTGIGQSSVITNSPVVSNASGSSVESLHPPVDPTASVVHPPAPAPPASSPSMDSSLTMVPLKSTMMDHLRQKYLAELEYMLLEFRKLERQLLGAKGAAQIEESAGSRERREKLHSFILHLEDTIRQIEEGCRLEDASLPPKKEDSVDGQSTISHPPAPDTLAKRKETEESVQKLEEHILANLLPVKVRLKKQLAAQQGATRNPAGMPAPRRGSYVASSSTGTKGTFAAAAEQRQKQAEAARLAAQEQQEQKMREVSDPTQFGAPLKGGSSLTRNLHGATLGSKQRIHGHGVGASTNVNEEPANERILYGGMVPESSQHRSGVAAASGVHEMVIENPSLLTSTESVETAEAPAVASHPAVPLQSRTPVEVPNENILSHEPPPIKVAVAPPPVAKQPKPLPVQAIKVHEPNKEIIDKTLTEEERRKMRKKRRKRKLLRIARRRERERQRLVVTQPAHPAHIPMKVAGGGRKKAMLGKNNGRKKGPRAVEYICAQCNDPYNSTLEYNPWWALSQQECPKCRKLQIPRIDITAPANQIEYHPALLAHIDDNGGNVGASASAVSQYLPKPPPPLPPHARLVKPTHHQFRDPLPPGSDSDSDLSELSDGSLSDLSVGSNDSEFDLSSLTPAEQAEHETFGHKYKGPALSEDHASRLLVLMQHSSTCPCRHKSKRHRDVCRSVKYMMLHVRDCPGTTSNFDVCPFPWCRKVKHLLFHLVACSDPDQCKICSPTHLSPSLRALDGLNQFRAKKYRERLITFMKRSAAARRAAVTLAYNSKKVGPQTPYMTAKGASTMKPNPAMYAKHPPRSVPSSAIAKKGKIGGIPVTVATPPVVHCKPTSPTVVAHQPWTATQKGAPKAHPKQIRAPMPQHIQSSQDTPSHPAGKTPSATAINRVVHKVPAQPTYTSVEDPLRASAAQGVLNPSHASIPPTSGVALAASKPVALPKSAVPVPGGPSQNEVNKPLSAIPTFQAPTNAASNPVKPVRPDPTSVSQATPSKPLASHRAADGVPDSTKPQLEQSATVDTTAPPNAASPRPHLSTAPVAMASGATSAASELQEVGEKETTVQTHQTAAQTASSRSLPPVAVQLNGPPPPPVLASLPVSGSAQVQHVPSSHVKVETIAAPAVQPIEEVASQLNGSHLAHPGQPAAASSVSLSTSRVSKVGGSTSVEHQASMSSSLHPGASAPLQVTKQPTSGPSQTQAAPAPAPHSTLIPANSVPAAAANVQKTLQPVAALPSQIAKQVTEPTGPLPFPAKPLAPVTIVAAPAGLEALSSAYSSKHPAAVAASFGTSASATGSVETPPACTQNTATPPGPPTASLILNLGPTVHVTEPPTSGPLHAQATPTVVPSADATDSPVAGPMQAQRITTAPQTSIPASELAVVAPQSNLNSTQHPVAATRLSEAAKPTAGAVQPSPRAATTPVSTKETQRSSGQVVATTPKSRSAAQIVQTKREPGRPIPSNAAEHAPVEARKVEQSADIVQVGG